MVNKTPNLFGKCMLCSKNATHVIWNKNHPEARLCCYHEKKYHDAELTARQIKKLGITDWFDPSGDLDGLI